MNDSQETETSEAQIAVHWGEEASYQPSQEFIAQANMTDPDVLTRFSLENFPECFSEYADLLNWDQKWDCILETSDAPSWKWFTGGKLNACANCIDRHLPHRANQIAFHFVSEREEEGSISITYQELHTRVNAFASLLRNKLRLKTGDRVTIYMPMSLELPITMLACARLGIIHSVVFGGFSSRACADRIIDSTSRILITMDGYYRSGKLLRHKENADRAADLAQQDGHPVERVLVWKRYPNMPVDTSRINPDRDIVVNDVMGTYLGTCVDPVSMPAEAPLFLMYTSGTTGKPKGCQHSTGGYLSYVTGTSKYILDIHPNDVYWCMADIGWITGHSYIVYGPLSLGTTSVIYEGVPTYPDAGRAWRIASNLHVNIFHTAPTTIRALRKLGPDEPRKHTYAFKLMTTVGEPIEPEVWKWYYDVVGKGKATIIDTWWQTETGGFLCSTIPGIHPMKPGSAGGGMPGIHPVIYDDDGNVVPAGSNTAGNICIQNPWPGGFQTIWGDQQRFLDTYYARYCRNPQSKDWRDWPYLTGDAAMQSADGYYRILGRIDDVINVSGHRLGTKELESAILLSASVAEAAVVPVIDEIKGHVPDAYISLRPGCDPSEELEQSISTLICEAIGKIARPRKIWIVSDMPKTRSGKIMRRVLAAISNNHDVGDITTLANPEVVDQIMEMVRNFESK